MSDPEPLDGEKFARWWRETGEHELRQILYWKWDPIGVNDYFPRTADEYDRYAPEVASVLRKGSGPDIAALLQTIEHERIGFDGNRREQLQTLASEIVSWATQSQESWQNFRPVGCSLDREPVISVLRRSSGQDDHNPLPLLAQATVTARVKTQLLSRPEALAL